MTLNLLTYLGQRNKSTSDVHREDLTRTEKYLIYKKGTGDNLGYIKIKDEKRVTHIENKLSADKITALTLSK